MYFFLEDKPWQCQAEDPGEGERVCRCQKKARFQRNGIRVCGLHLNLEETPVKFESGPQLPSSTYDLEQAS